MPRPSIKVPGTRAQAPGVMPSFIKGKHAQEFWTFHKANPRVYEILVDKARIIKKKGYHRIGIRLLWEVMRWDSMMEVADPSQYDFKLNDHYHSHYARLIMARELDLVGLFELREKHERKWPSYLG